MYLQRLLTLLLCMGLTLTLYARKEFGQIKSLIKSGKNLDKAVAMVKQLEQDSTLGEDRAETEYYGFLVQQKYFSIENEKLYLKQKYDTARYFASIYGMYHYAMVCAATEHIPSENGKVKLKYSPKMRTQILPIYPNVRSAGIYYYNKGDFKQAAQYFTLYIRCTQVPPLGKDSLQRHNTLIPQAAYMAMVSFANTQQYDSLLCYKDYALQDSTLRAYALENVAQAHLKLGDTLSLSNTLRIGVREYPLEKYFFTSLSDLYLQREQYDSLLHLCDDLLLSYPDNRLFQFAKTMAFLRLKRYPEVIALSQKLLANEDSVNAEVYFNIGAAYVYMAQEQSLNKKMQIETNVQATKEVKKATDKLYEGALPYVEKFKKANPKAEARYVPLLYLIYLNLNMGREFKAIEPLMEQLQEKGLLH